MLTLFPGIMPFNGCNESKSLSYFSRSAGLIDQSPATEGGKDVINGVGVGLGVLLGGGGFGGRFIIGSLSPYKTQFLIYQKKFLILTNRTILGGGKSKCMLDKLISFPA